MSAEVNAIETTHKLDFLSAPWNNPMNDQGWQEFKVGTCKGQWRHTDRGFEILSVINEEPGNGHINDLFEWFEYACRRDKSPLWILEVWNKRFKKHLIEKRGFVAQDDDNVFKIYK